MNFVDSQLADKTKGTVKTIVDVCNHVARLYNILKYTSNSLFVTGLNYISSRGGLQTIVAKKIPLSSPDVDKSLTNYLESFFKL